MKHNNRVPSALDFLTTSRIFSKKIAKTSRTPLPKFQLLCIYDFSSSFKFYSYKSFDENVFSNTFQNLKSNCVQIIKHKDVKNRNRVFPAEYLFVSNTSAETF